MDRIAATFGPACLLPIWIQFFRLSKYFDRRNWTKPLRGIRAARPFHRTVQGLIVR